MLLNAAYASRTPPANDVVGSSSSTAISCTASVGLATDRGSSRRVVLTRLLPESCRLLIVAHMDSISRAAWRVVNKQARQDVNVATTRLTWQGTNVWQEVTTKHMLRVPLPLTSTPDPKPWDLPDALMALLPNLYHLDCTNMTNLNSIQGIPCTLRSLNLTECAFLEDLQPLLYCYQLEELTVGGTRYDATDIARFIAAIAPALSPGLRRLTITPLRPGVGHRDADTDRAYLQALAALYNLQHLSIRLTRFLSAEDWQGFALSLSRMAYLQILDLSCSEIGSALPALVPAIGQLKQLRSLQLWGGGRPRSCLGTKGCKDLAQAVSSLPAQLTRLCLLDCDISVAGAKALARALPSQSATLASLQLKANELKGVGMEALAPGLERCTALTELSLVNNSIRARGAAALAAVLPSLAPRLTSLDLSGNVLKWEGAEDLAPGLGALAGLQSLSIGKNALKADGLAVLAPVLRSLRLRRLDIHGNELLREGEQILRRALAKMTALRTLLVENIDVGWESWAYERDSSSRLFPWLTVEMVHR